MRAGYPFCEVDFFIQSCLLSGLEHPLCVVTFGHSPFYEKSALKHGRLKSGHQQDEIQSYCRVKKILVV